MHRRVLFSIALSCGLALGAGTAWAGAVNPNISVIAQPYTRWTNDVTSPSSKRVTFNQGELELQFDAYLNPYALGVVIPSLGDEGLELEEAYFLLLRSLPASLQLKGGKYLVAF